jgi:hypothetical protein
LKLKIVCVDRKSYFKSDIMLYLESRTSSTPNYWGHVGRLVDVARFNYVVADRRIELLQTITAPLKLTILNISDYSRTFDDSYSLLKSDVTY